MISVYVCGHDIRENENKQKKMYNYEDNGDSFIGREDILEAEKVINTLKDNNAELLRKNEDL